MSTQSVILMTTHPLHSFQMSDLEDEIKVLQQKLQEREEALQKAGQYGLQVLYEKMELHNKLEEQQIEMSSVIEVLTRY